MQGNIWLKIAAVKKYGRWSVGPVHALKTKPATDQNEIAIQLSLDIPDALFETPQFKAMIRVPSDSVTSPVIDAEIATNLAEVLSQQLGMTVRVEAETAEEAHGSGS